MNNIKKFSMMKRANAVREIIQKEFPESNLSIEEKYGKIMLIAKRKRYAVKVPIHGNGTARQEAVSFMVEARSYLGRYHYQKPYYVPYYA